MPGESPKCMSEGVTYLCPFSGPLKGNLYLTNYKLFFRAKDKSTASVTSFEVPLGLVNPLKYLHLFSSLIK